jgi:hypothetical protein
VLYCIGAQGKAYGQILSDYRLTGLPSLEEMKGGD